MKTLARIARVNVCKIVVDSLAQSLFVDGFREKTTTTTRVEGLEDVAGEQDGRPPDRRSTAPPFAYGAAYAIVLPGDPYPVIRPRRRGR
jgi:hypothetical protein